jgi:hypothetical protein
MPKGSFFLILPVIRDMPGETREGRSVGKSRGSGSDGKMNEVNFEEIRPSCVWHASKKPSLSDPRSSVKSVANGQMRILHGSTPTRSVSEVRTTTYPRLRFGLVWRTLSRVQAFAFSGGVPA